MPISPTELAKRTGISVPYACQLLNNDPKQKRTPSLAVALRVYDKTGLQLGFLANLTPKEIEPLRRKAA